MARLSAVVVVLLPLLAAAAPSSPPPPAPLSTLAAACDNATHFICHDAAALPCIPMEWQCDNVRDCPDGSDEGHCAYLHVCPKKQLMCRNGECVSSQFRCDGNVDCTDGSDEQGCTEMETVRSVMASLLGSRLAGIVPQSPFAPSTTRTPAVVRRPPPRAECGANEYQCKDGPCITRAAHCDGIWDCAYGDDENNCPAMTKKGAKKDASRSQPRDCSQRESRMCADGNECIPRSWWCDGSPDCFDESDEAECKVEELDIAELLTQQIRKSQKEKIHGLQQQEEGEGGEETKGDGELSMLDFLNAGAEASSRRRCASGEFTCGNGACINETQTCDGRRDCAAGDDETERCGECRDARTHCSHQCIDTPKGRKCACPVGMQLSAADDENCEEINECLHGGRQCSQYCEDRRAGYVCTCAPGYTLTPDDHTCRLEPPLDGEPDGVIYVSLTSEIRSMPLFSPLSSAAGYETFVSTHLGTSRSIDINVAQQKMYLALQGPSHKGALAVVHEQQLRALRENITGLGYVAVDWIGDNVLYTAKFPNPAPGIYLCAASGLFCKRIVAGRVDEKSRQQYRGLAVNPHRGVVAWIDVFGSSHKIMAANLDGTNVRTVVDHKLDYPCALAIDIIRNDLYFADVEKMLIEKVNLDNIAERSVVLSNGVHHPYDMAFFNGFLYWTDWGTETLKVASLGRQHSSPHLIHSFMLFPYGIALNHTMVQPPLSTNPCVAGASGPGTCVAVPSDEHDTRSDLKAVWVCPEEGDESAQMGGSSPCNMRPDANVTAAEWKDGSDEEEAEESSSGSGGFGFLAFFICLVLVGACAGLLYLASRKSDTFNEVRRSTMQRVAEARLPERAASAMKATAAKAATITKHHLGGSPPRTQPVAASYVAPQSARGGSPSGGMTTRASAPTLTAATFSNPAFEIHNSTALPYSGFQEINTSEVTEPSFFSVEREPAAEEEQETMGVYPQL